MTYSTRHAVSAGGFRWRGPDYPYDLPRLRNTLSPKGFQ